MHCGDCHENRTEWERMREGDFNRQSEWERGKEWLKEREVEICSECVWVGDEKSVSCIFCLTGDDRKGNAPHYPEAKLTNQSDTAEVKVVTSLSGSKHGGKHWHWYRNENGVIRQQKTAISTSTVCDWFTKAQIQISDQCYIKCICALAWPKKNAFNWKNFNLIEKKKNLGIVISIHAILG